MRNRAKIRAKFHARRNSAHWWRARVNTFSKLIITAILWPIWGFEIIWEIPIKAQFDNRNCDRDFKSNIDRCARPGVR